MQSNIYKHTFRNFPRQQHLITKEFSELSCILFFFKQPVHKNRFSFCSESTKLGMKLNCLATETSKIFSFIKNQFLCSLILQAGTIRSRFSLGLSWVTWILKCIYSLCFHSATYTCQKSDRQRWYRLWF